MISFSTILYTNLLLVHIDRPFFYYYWQYEPYRRESEKLKGRTELYSFDKQIEVKLTHENILSDHNGSNWIMMCITVAKKNIYYVDCTTS